MNEPQTLQCRLPNCAICGHEMAMHFKNVLGEVRCLVVEHGESTGGIRGMPYHNPCDCTDGVSALAEAKVKAEAKAEEEERERFAESLRIFEEWKARRFANLLDKQP